jgi:hypothetical protein
VEKVHRDYAIVSFEVFLGHVIDAGFEVYEEGGVKVTKND